MKMREITSKDVVRELVDLRQLTFEVTDACNLRCKYCGYGDLYLGYDKRESQYLHFDKVKSLLDYFACLWRDNTSNQRIPETYISFYGGEPLMNMKLIRQTVDYVGKMDVHRKFLFSMTTNAMLLDKYSDYLVEKDFSLLVSLDGDCQAHSYRVTHDGKNSFDRVFDNIKKMQIEHPDYFNNKVNFNAVLHNRSSVEGVNSFLKSEFGKLPTISELNNSGIRLDKVEEFEKTYRNKQESLLSSEHYHELVEEMFMKDAKTNDLLIYLHRYSGNVFNNYKKLLVKEENLSYVPTGTCIPFAKRMFVTVNGKILQCERIDHDFALGAVDEEGVFLDVEKIAHTFNGYLAKIKKQCAVCFRNKNCIQCLYYIEGIHSNSPVCKGFMNEKAFENYTSYCLEELKKRPHLYKKLMTEVIIE